MKINVEIADTELENNEIDINKMGTLAARTRNTARGCPSKINHGRLSKFQTLDKKGIIHRMSQHDDPKRTVSRFLESKI
jgi:hypothetical protein